MPFLTPKRQVFLSSLLFCSLNSSSLSLAFPSHLSSTNSPLSFFYSLFSFPSGQPHHHHPLPHHPTPATNPHHTSQPTNQPTNQPRTRTDLISCSVSTPAATIVVPTGYGTFRLPVNSFTGRTKLAYRLSLRLRCHSHPTVIGLLSFFNCRPNGQSIAPSIAGFRRIFLSLGADQHADYTYSTYHDIPNLANHTVVLAHLPDQLHTGPVEYRSFN